jgi:hypothetical protein
MRQRPHDEGKQTRRDKLNVLQPIDKLACLPILEECNAS